VKPRPHQVLVRLSELEREALDRAAARIEETPAGYLRYLLRTRLNLPWVDDEEGPTDADVRWWRDYLDAHDRGERGDD
jgi:hypothetical protein